jgi:hypothetical protein
VYGHAVAQKKELLSDDFGHFFNSESLLISTRKKLKDANGKTIGEIDAAVFDPTDGLRVIFEIKWIIMPDSTKETIRAEHEIEEGLGQLRGVKSEYDRDPIRFLQQIFPSQNNLQLAIKQVRYFVVGNGEVGCQDDLNTPIYVLDYYLATEKIKEHEGAQLNEIIEMIIKFQRNLCLQAAERQIKMKTRIGGYIFCQPGIFLSESPKDKSKKSDILIEQKSPCFCGSGLAYKNCCMRLVRWTPLVGQDRDRIK